jgi:hypothetical protein
LLSNFGGHDAFCGQLAETVGVKAAAGVVQAKIEQAKRFGPHHIPILSAVRNAIRALPRRDFYPLTPAHVERSGKTHLCRPRDHG